MGMVGVQEHDRHRALQMMTLSGVDPRDILRWNMETALRLAFCLLQTKIAMLRVRFEGAVPLSTKRVPQSRHSTTIRRPIDRSFFRAHDRQDSRKALVECDSFVAFPELESSPWAPHDVVSVSRVSR